MHRLYAYLAGRVNGHGGVCKALLGTDNLGLFLLVEEARGAELDWNLLGKHFGRIRACRAEESRNQRRPLGNHSR